MEDALLRQDAADEEGDENDDRHRAQAHAVDLVDHGREAERVGRASMRSAAATFAPTKFRRDFASS